MSEKKKLPFVTKSKIICGENHSIFLSQLVKPQIFSTLNTTFKKGGKYKLKDLKISKFSHYNKIPSNTKITQISSGKSHVLLLTDIGEVYSMGANDRGQLGIGNISAFSALPQIINNLPEIQQVKCGDKTSYFLSHSGCVYSCGLNDCGQLGYDTRRRFKKFYRYKPRRISPLAFLGNKIQKIKVGSLSKHVWFIGKKEIFRCGNNRFGQLGNTMYRLINNRPLQFFRKWPINDVKIEVGKECTIFLRKKEGRVFVCGLNYVIGRHMSFKYSKNEIFGNGELGLDSIYKKTSGPIELSWKERIVKIKCTGANTFFWNEKNELFGCGRNVEKQISRKNEKMIFRPIRIGLNDVRTVGGGCYHVMYLTRNGKIFASGSENMLPGNSSCKNFEFICFLENSVGFEILKSLKNDNFVDTIVTH